MKTSVSSVLFFLLGTGLSFTTAASEAIALQEFEREYNKRFDVRPDVALQVDCSFADLTLYPSEENIVTVDIEVRIKAKSQQQADKKFERLRINIDGAPRRVDIVAEVMSDWNGQKDDLEIQINITAPVNSILDLSADFGAVNSGTFGNKTTLNADFSKLDCEGFTHSDVNITSTYSSGRIRRFHGGKINVEFGSLAIEELNGNTTVQNSYSNIEIASVGAKTASLEIDNEFGSISLNISPDAGFRIEGESSFGRIELPQSALIKHIEKEMMSTEVEATVGRNTSGEIVIDTSFGDVIIDMQ